MKLKQILDTLDGLDEAMKGLYVQGDDGKFHLEVEGLGEMQTALKKANSEAAERRKQLEAFKDVDPAKYAELLKSQEDAALKDAESKGQWDKLREQMNAKQTEEKNQWTKREQMLRSTVEQHLVDAQATAAIAEAKGIPEFLLHHIKGRVKVIEQDGKFTTQILDAAGNQMLADSSGAPATFKHLVESFKADPRFGRAFEGSGVSGGGTPPGTGKGTSSKTMARAAFQSLSPVEQMAHVKANGAGSITD